MRFDALWIPKITWRLISSRARNIYRNYLRWLTYWVSMTFLCSTIASVKFSSSWWFIPRIKVSTSLTHVKFGLILCRPRLIRDFHSWESWGMSGAPSSCKRTSVSRIKLPSVRWNSWSLSILPWTWFFTFMRGNYAAKVSLRSKWEFNSVWTEWLVFIMVLARSRNRDITLFILF